MHPDDTTEWFLQREVPFSKSQVNKQGSRWRDGMKFDPKPIDDYMTFSASHTTELLSIADQTISSLILDINPNDEEKVRPDTKSYALSARVKSEDTLLQKLRRMKNTPLMNIHDVAGIRFDCDLTLTEQTKVAEAFAEGFKNHGAKRVDIKDFRQHPHSGYRAVHLHIRSTAGRSEMQIRTALQSKWANLYEEAADIFGRSIRYLHEGEAVPPGATQTVEELQDVSKLVERVENLSDHSALKRNGEVKELRTEVYGILDNIQGGLNQWRKKDQIERRP
ncbi:GTP pyrophosphokinase [Corynebacterium diphtheriae]|uniref:GTP pyrophosphokinase n=1 Tax=Corynebacterium diphtheriae TaxID=1717 RepID=UPI000245A89E|nr:GTP pyrophosphokinase [Corynebacterium diphtheriae]AEX42350.1 GTP pyrophosphokinase [Corynebacterium diphtheriae 31A]CAB0730715.1 GTP pyrophosphokinase [Corynebacterium diphtheriae]